jgi:hypothetical protein
MLSVTVDRTSLGAAALSIPDFPTAGLWIPEDGLSRPGKTWTKQTATSPFTHGTVTTRAKLEQATINLSVYAQGVSTAAVVALQDEVEAAFAQFAYTVTITLDGSAKSYVCDPADLSWGDLLSPEAKAFMARATLTIPCHPVAGAGGATTGLYVVAPTVPLP